MSSQNNSAYSGASNNNRIDYYTGYRTTSSGTNSQGNRWSNRDYGEGVPNDNPYHYSNINGSYYYNNPDGSKYCNNSRGNAVYIRPEKNASNSTSYSGSNQTGNAPCQDEGNTFSYSTPKPKSSSYHDFNPSGRGDSTYERRAENASNSKSYSYANTANTSSSHSRDMDDSGHSYTEYFIGFVEEC